MDLEFKKLIAKIIKDDLGDIVSKELEIRFKPIQKQIETIQKGQDLITENLRTDRKDIDAIKIGQATSEKQNRVIIENQNDQEGKIIEAVKEGTKEIPAVTKKSVESMFTKKPFLQKIKERFK